MKTETVKNCKVIIGCFVIQFLVAGATRLTSIYFVEFITRYNVDRKQASFPLVITFMVKNLSGPIIGFLEQIIGMKWIITIGCIMATFGIGGCFFAEEILVIIILWGVILGLSYGFAHNMQAPLLNQHFKSNKNKANGIVLAGSSLGGVLLPVIATACIQAFGTSGSFLILSAIIAHSIPASLLIENPPTKTIDCTPKENIEEINKSDSKSISLANISNTAEYLCMEQSSKGPSSSYEEKADSEDLNVTNSFLNNDKNSKTPTNILTTDDYLRKEQTHKRLSSFNVAKLSPEDHSTSQNNSKIDNAGISNTVDNLRTIQTNKCLLGSNDENVDSQDLSTSNSSLDHDKNTNILTNIRDSVDNLSMVKTNKCLSYSIDENADSQDLSTLNSPLDHDKNTKTLTNITDTVDNLNMEQNSKCLSISKVRKPFSKYQGNSNSFLNSSKNDKILINNQTEEHLSNSSVENASSENFNTTNSSFNKSCDKRKHCTDGLSRCDSSSSVSPNKVTSTNELRKNVEIFSKIKFASRNFRIFIDPTFIVILIFNALVAAVMVTVWTIILDFVRDKEVPESLEIYYVILLPLTDIIGRLGSGYIADKNFLSFSQLCFTTFFVEAMALLLIVYVNNFMLVMVCEIVISICFGMTVILQIAMVDKFMEEDLKTMAQSCRVMLYAPLSLTISPMLGYFRGGYGSYDYVFYILSGTTLFSGCSVCLLPYLSKRRYTVKTTRI